MSEVPKIAAEIEGLVGRLNAAWLAGRFDELGTFFHPDVIVSMPGPAERLTGRERCVQSYRDFTARAKIHAFELRSVRVDVIAQTAVAWCPYVIDYELDGRRWRGDGTDLLVLTQRDDAWEVVWRTLIPGEEEAIEG